MPRRQVVRDLPVFTAIVSPHIGGGQGIAQALETLPA